MEHEKIIKDLQAELEKNKELLKTRDETISGLQTANAGLLKDKDDMYQLVITGASKKPDGAPVVADKPVNLDDFELPQ